MSADPAEAPGDNNAMGAIDEAMGALAKVLAAEHAAIKAERARLAKERDEIDKIKNRLMSCCAAENERLKINVGGSRFEIRVSCIQKNTYFRSLHSGTFAPKDDDGHYYIDRDATYMPFILCFLRETDLDFSVFNDQQLDKLRLEAEFYMAQDLQAKIEAIRNTKRAQHGVMTALINRHVSYSDCFFANGIVFEFQVLRRDMQLHCVSFLAGDKRKIVGEVYLKAGTLDVPGKFDKIGDVDENAEKFQLMHVNFSSITLSNPVYCLAVYSASCPTAVSMVPKAVSVRDYTDQGFKITKSYHTSDPRGQFSKRAGADDTYDFIGEIKVTL